MKYKILFIFFIFFGLLGCDNDNNNEYYSNLIGDYEATTFVEPGASDQGVDILANGGYLHLTLYNNAQFSLEMFIPNNINSNYSTDEKWFFNSNYTIKADSIYFNQLSHPFPNSILVWHKIINKLETMDVEPRGKPFKIIL